MAKITPKRPIKVSFAKPLLMGLLEIMLWLILIITGVNILTYYIYLIMNYGWFDIETVKIAIYLIIGAYFFLVIDKKKIYDLLGVKLKNQLKEELW